MLDNTENIVSATSAPDVTSTDHPPAYEDSASPSRLSHLPDMRAIPLPRNVQTSNFLHLSTPGQPINNKFIIDPNLPVSRSLLPPLGSKETEGTRANLSLVSARSHVYAEVWVVPGPERELSTSMVPPSSIVRLNTQSIHSHVTLIVHNDAHTLPLRITCGSTYSKVKLYLPRSFVGTIKASSEYGRVKFSAAVRAQGTLLGNVDNTIRLFIGNMDPPPNGSGEESNDRLDEVEVEARYAGLAVYFEDEVRGHMSKPWMHSGSRSGFGSLNPFQKWFGGGGGTAETTGPNRDAVTPCSTSKSPLVDLGSKVSE
ncbi:hypothetical protein DL96DRAFT_1589861 [Flagelloscypha sp. PMI_526]|nr:hypothetical protein DL96DRAFT_1589861 [Flagelloscypha sp. PMI_526]